MFLYFVVAKKLALVLGSAVEVAKTRVHRLLILWPILRLIRYFWLILVVLYLSLLSLLDLIRWRLMVDVVAIDIDTGVLLPYTMPYFFYLLNLSPFLSDCSSLRFNPNSLC